MFFNLEDLHNESDVEQKFIIQLLTSPTPTGFGYSLSEFRTKPDIRRLQIGKGAGSKLYYPDYAIIIQGLPVLIIEAKHPNEELSSACKEARLYAQELNAIFPHNINPCQKIIATNGKQIIATFYDSEKEEITLTFEEIFIGSEKYSKLIDFGSKNNLTEFTNEKFKNIRGNTDFIRPLNLLGGKAVQNQELEQNSFGATLALDYRHLFNPSALEDRKNIVKNAYVPSRRRMSHVDPIERIIKSAIPISVSSLQQIEDTGTPVEITSKFNNISKLKNTILLLIGGVGSGKSTFIDYLTEIGLSEELKNKTVWLNADLNKAPVSREEIYNWLCESLIKKFREIYPGTDFDDLNTLKKLYSVEIRKIEKGPAALFEQGSIEFKKIIANELQRLITNSIDSLKSYIRYMCGERGKLAVIVLDNCDKRTREDQLLMFEVAKWVQDQYGCLVVLPLRDTTFDHHRKEPPLDTVIKDLTFRIDPPLLINVIAKRVKYALAQISKDAADRGDTDLLSYVLPNNMRVEYPRSEQGMYLACILRSLFSTETYFRRIITGISGRDIRRGLEIFLEFCKSGHITPDEILRIRHSQGAYTLPRHIIMRVLLRGSMKYYKDSGSTIKNLFLSYPEDIIPDPFIRVEILRWLEKRYRQSGPSGIKGFHKTSELISAMVSLGHSIDRVKHEIVSLMKAGCIFSESQNPERLQEEDLLAISPSGHVHLDLIPSIDYLAACSEDFWYKDSDVADRIRKRISNQIGAGHLSQATAILNADDLINYLQRYRSEFISEPQIYLEEGHFEKLFDISKCIENVEKAKSFTNLGLEQKLLAQYPPSTVVEGEIVSIQDYGIFLKFGFNEYGFIHIAKLAKLGLDIYGLEVGNRIRARIVDYNSTHKRFTLDPVLE